MSIRKIKHVICAGLLIVHADAFSASFDVDSDIDFDSVSEEVKNICRQIDKTTPPQADSPLDNFQHCDALSHYYGLEQSADFNKARQCAYVQKDYGVLSMIYANGKGVSRNWDWAIYFACRAGFAPAEVEARVEHLVQLKKDNSAQTNFDICDDVTSGYMIGNCADIQDRLQQSQQQLKLAALMSGWTDQDKKSFAQLNKAAQNFFNKRLDNEIDLSGTASEALVMEEKKSLEDTLMNSLQQLKAGQFPHYSTSEYAQKDRELNTLYQNILAEKDFSEGTVTKSGIKKTQKAWIQYKNAWLVFAKSKYPQISDENWQGWLTDQRIQMLQEFAPR